MIILDTCAIIFDALTPQKLSTKAKNAIKKADLQNQLYCCDISLWEIAMLIQKKRLDPGVEIDTFLQLVLDSRQINLLNITPEIAKLSASEILLNKDPADRIIAASAMHWNAKLITSDQKLQSIAELTVIW